MKWLQQKNLFFLTHLTFWGSHPRLASTSPPYSHAGTQAIVALPRKVTLVITVQAREQGKDKYRQSSGSGPDIAHLTFVYTPLGKTCTITPNYMEVKDCSVTG